MTPIMKIARAFNRAEHSYDEHAEVQTYACQQLINRLLPHRQSVDRIIDLGCGSGLSTAMLCENIQHQQLIAVDVADKLLQKIRQRYLGSTVQCVQADFSSAVAGEQSVDLIFSSMSFHWCADPRYAMYLIASQLKFHGIFACCFPLIGSLSSLFPLYCHQFPAFSWIAQDDLRAGMHLLHASTQPFTVKYPDRRQALTALKNVGVTARSARDGQASASIKQVKEFIETPGEFSLDYQLGYYIFQRVI